MLSGTFFSGTDEKALSKKNAQELLKKGWAHKKVFPSKLFVPEGLLTDGVEAAAQGEGISVDRVPESQLLDIIGEAQEEFRRRFG